MPRATGGGLQRGFTRGFAALVVGGALRVGPQCANVHHTAHPRGAAGLRQALRQRGVRLGKGCATAVQNRHQIHHGVVPRHQAGQRVGLVHVGHQRGHQRQVRQPSRRTGVPGGYRDGHAQALQGLTQVPSHKAGTAQNQNASIRHALHYRNGRWRVRPHQVRCVLP